MTELETKVVETAAPVASPQPTGESSSVDASQGNGQPNAQVAPEQPSSPAPKEESKPLLKLGDYTANSLTETPGIAKKIYGDLSNKLGEKEREYKELYSNNASLKTQFDQLVVITKDYENLIARMTQDGYTPQEVSAATVGIRQQIEQKQSMAAAVVQSIDPSKLFDEKIAEYDRKKNEAREQEEMDKQLEIETKHYNEFVKANPDAPIYAEDITQLVSPEGKVAFRLLTGKNQEDLSVSELYEAAYQAVKNSALKKPDIGTPAAPIMDATTKGNQEKASETTDLEKVADEYLKDIQRRRELRARGFQA